MSSISRVLAAQAEIGESPVWNAEESVLYWTDIFGQRLHRFDPATGQDREWPLRDRLASFAFCEGGGMVGAFHSGFAMFSVERSNLSWIARPLAGDERVYLNDGRCDRSGRAFWAGSVDRAKKEKNGALFRFAADGSWKQMADGVTSSNGIAFSPDNTVLYYADSRGFIIWQFDHDPDTGNLSNRRVFSKFEEDGGFADGAAVDAEGHYWSARVHRGSLIRHRPDGSVEREIKMPTSAPTMVAFGGEDLRTLFITSGRRPLAPERLADEPQAGSLYAMRVDVPGLPEPRFRPDPALRNAPQEPLFA